MGVIFPVENGLATRCRCGKLPGGYDLARAGMRLFGARLQRAQYGQLFRCWWWRLDKVGRKARSPAATILRSSDDVQQIQMAQN